MEGNTLDRRSVTDDYMDGNLDVKFNILFPLDMKMCREFVWFVHDGDIHGWSDCRENFFDGVFVRREGFFELEKAGQAQARLARSLGGRNNGPLFGAVHCGCGRGSCRV